MGWKTVSFVCCIGSALEFGLLRRVRLQDEVKREGENCNGLGICITSTASLWKPAFMATLVE